VAIEFPTDWKVDYQRLVSDVRAHNNFIVRNIFQYLQGGLQKYFYATSF